MYQTVVFVCRPLLVLITNSKYLGLVSILSSFKKVFVSVAQPLLLCYFLFDFYKMDSGGRSKGKSVVNFRIFQKLTDVI